MILRSRPNRSSCSAHGFFTQGSRLTPTIAEDVHPKRGDGRAPLCLRVRVDARMRRAGQAHLVLEPTIFAVSVGRRGGNIDRNEAELAGDAEKRDIAGVASE